MAVAPDFAEWGLTRSSHAPPFKFPPCRQDPVITQPLVIAAVARRPIARLRAEPIWRPVTVRVVALGHAESVQSPVEEFGHRHIRKHRFRHQRCANGRWWHIFWLRWAPAALRPQQPVRLLQRQFEPINLADYRHPTDAEQAADLGCRHGGP